MTQRLAANNSNEFLFDQYERTDLSGGRIAESAFEFFNRSAWRCAEVARTTLESWFANIPNEKRADLRARFRDDDRRHPTALLELVTHEILRSVAEGIQVEPDLGGGHPDFSASYLGTKFITECTVAQESDVRFGALRREQIVLDAINSIDAGDFRLMVEPISIGENQPSLSGLRNLLLTWLASLAPEGGTGFDCSGLSHGHKIWEWQGWKLRFEAILVNSLVGGGAIGGTISEAQCIVDDSIISRALKKKSERYRKPQAAYLIVMAQKASLGEPAVILDSLFGRERWIVGGVGVTVQPRQFDGFWGRPSQPRNRHVSAVLYKRRLTNAWDICRMTLASNDFTPLLPVPEWYLVHNPFADNPLPQGIFPFAVEYAWQFGKLVTFAPRNSLNDVLGLPDPWPGEDH